MVAIVEIPEGQRYKYEIKKGVLVLDRVLDYRVPGNYGYITGTKAKDGDALDVFIAANEALLPTAHVPITVVGAFICKDNGVLDEKLVALIEGREFLTDTHRDIEIHRIRDYLNKYKEGFVVLEYVGAEDATKLVKKYTLKGRKRARK